MPTIEIGIIRDFVPLFSLLNSDAHNRMAFDYFMAWCLLDRNSLPMIADYIHLLKAMGYTSMPTHLQEAILLLQETAGITVDTHGLGYDAATVSRFRAFAQQMASYRDRRSAQLGLRSAFGGTYMYYYCFQGTPPAPRRASVHYALAGRLHYQGKAELAVTQYRHALHLEPTFVEAHVELAHALVSLEKETQAAVHYRRALRLKPDAAEAREGLDRITARQTDQGG